MTNANTTARFIETETVDGVVRRWFEVDGEEFALTDDNRLLDADGVPLVEGDVLAQNVRRAIEGAAA